MGYTLKNYTSFSSAKLNAMVKRLQFSIPFELCVIYHKNISVHGWAYRKDKVVELFLPATPQTYPLNLTNDDFPGERTYLLSFDEEVFFVLSHEIRHLQQPRDLQHLPAERDAEDWALERLTEFRRDGFQGLLRAI